MARATSQKKARHRESPDVVKLRGLAKRRSAGATLSELARKTGIDIANLSRRLKIPNLPSEVLNLMSPDLPDKERLSVSSAEELATLRAPREEVIDLARQVASRKITFAGLRQIKRQYHGGQPADPTSPQPGAIPKGKQLTAFVRSLEAKLDTLLNGDGTTVAQDLAGLSVGEHAALVKRLCDAVVRQGELIKEAEAAEPKQS